MLTLFSTPKPFRGHIGIAQTNAIRSWVLLRPACEVILFGNEEGTAEVTSRFRIRHVPDVDCNKYGTPLINSMFNIAQDIASHQIMCYVNADIIFMSDFLPAVQRVQKRPFLIIGRRWDIELNESLDFDEAQWELQLRARVAKYGKLHPPTGIDYLVFSAGLWNNIPPLVVGRPAWDNWMVYQARKLKAPLIDATDAITAIHQNHDYLHHPEGTAGVWKGPEAVRNLELRGGPDNGFTLEEANWILTPRGMKRALSIRHLYFQMRAIPILYPKLHFLLALFKAMERLIIAFRARLVKPSE